MITLDNLDLQIERQIDGSFKWYTSGCRPLPRYEPYACVKATAMSDRGSRFNVLTVIPPEVTDEADIIDMTRRAALLNANFPEMIDKSYEAGILDARVEDLKRGGLVQ